MRATLLLPCAALASCTALYDPCFGSAQKIRDLRVLAVRSDPPETIFDPAEAELPPVEVSLLMADPQTNDDVTVTALACAPTDDKRCPPGSAVAGRVSGGLPVLSFMADIPRSLLDTALAADPLHGYGGIRVQLDLTVHGTFGREVTASKLLLYNPPADGYVPNHAFEILGLQITRQGGPAGFLDGRQSLEGAVAEQIGLRPQLLPGKGADAAAEEYEVVDLAGQRARLREHISYSVFSTIHGHFFEDSADEPPAGSVPPLNGLFTFQPTLEANGRLYVVARDGRGAVAWLTSQWFGTETRAEGRKGNIELDCE